MIKIKGLNKRVELLAPAGSFEAMRAAVNAGADAVYMGGLRFGARAYADNPDEDGMIKAIEFCHLHGKRLYMTVNTLFKENELSNQLEAYLRPYYEAGLDAVIVQDAGAVRFISEHFKGLDIHLSTQCTITMAEGAEYLKTEGGSADSITRLVPARELSLNELSEMRENTDLEIEVFVHGALCYCYSGQCLLSSMAGGRSGNRGRCAQPCRRMYTNSANGERGYYLSPKDMCALPYIHKMIDAGMDSFKIEGRMKSPEYVAGVVSVYRKFIDIYYEKGSEKYAEWIEGEGATELEKAIDTLRELYNRGGFNSGYLFSHNGIDMMSLKRPNHSGVRVGSVLKCEGRKAYIRLERAVQKGDVLEIRTASEKGEKALYEFTLGEDYSSGVIFSVLTMKDRTAAPGLEVFRTRNSSLLEQLDEQYLKNDSRIAADIFFKAEEGQETCLTMRLADDKSNAAVAGNGCAKPAEVSVYGNRAEAAQKLPTGEEDVKKQLQKLGNTPFAAADIHISLEGNVFIPVGELNRLRRDAAEALEAKIRAAYHRDESTVYTTGMCDIPTADGSMKFVLGEKAGGKVEKWAEEKAENIAENNNKGQYISVLVSGAEQLKVVLEREAVDFVYFDITGKDYINDVQFLEEITARCEQAGKKLYFALPSILRSDRRNAIAALIDRFRGRTAFLARNREELQLLKGAETRCDYQIYSMNSTAARLNSGGYTIPLELNENEINEIADDNSELIIYGLLPVMYSAQCVYKNTTGGCKRADYLRQKDVSGRNQVIAGGLSLTDEKGFKFPTLQICQDCYNIIYNSSVLNLLHRFDAVSKTGAGRLRLNFTGESASETRLVLDCLERVMNGGEYLLPEEMMGLKFTNGHFYRGVE